jgi:hypothetical protein
MAKPSSPLGRQDILQRVGDLRQWGGTRLVTLEEGAERGVRVVEVSTAAGLDFGVVVDRALDIGWFRWHGRACAWLSPTGFTGPWYREPEGMGFLRSFAGGLIATCGLDHILFPQVDAHDTYGYPGRTETSYGLHGRVSSTPGVLRHHGTTWDGDTPRIVVEGDVRQAGALAENLVLRRRVSTTLDGLDVLIEDEVTNEGHHQTPHMYLYHMNLGAPLLDVGTELVAPIVETTWRTPTAQTPGEHLEVPAPRAGFLEQAFLHDMARSDDGTVSVGLVNRSAADGPWGLEVRYDAEAFPVFLQWRYLDAGTYVIGFEPSTNGVGGREADRAAGRLILLEPGESRHYRTLVRVLPDAAACDELRDRVARALEGARSS